MAFCPNGGLPVSMPSSSTAVNQQQVMAGLNSQQGLPGPPNQQFCLKWNNHSLNMVKTFTDMIAGESFTDVTLACDGHIIKAHKIVLSACSNYFRDIFLATPCKHPIVVLKDMKIDELKAIIDFMYRGEVNVSQNQLGNLLKTAEVLRVKGLTEVNEAEGGLKTEEPMQQEEPMMMNGNIGQQVMQASIQHHHASPIKNGVFPHGVVHQEVIPGNVGQMMPFIQQQQQQPAVIPAAKKAKTKRKSTAAPKRSRAPSTNSTTSIPQTTTPKVIASSVQQQPHAMQQHVVTQVVQPPPTTSPVAAVVLPPTSSVQQHLHQPKTHNDLDSREEELHAANSIATLHAGEDIDSVEDGGDDDVVNDVRARMAVNSYGSVASTSSSTSPTPNTSSQTYPQEASTPESHRKRMMQHNQQSTSGQREVMSTDTSLADGMSNDGSESWSQQGNHSMSGFGMNRPPGDDDSESESSDVKPYISFTEGNDPSRPGDHDNPGLGLSYDGSQSGGPSTPGGTDASGSKICVCHLCHLTFTAYSSLRRHMARHFQDRERYECDVCFKSYSRKDYLKEHKKLKHPPGTPQGMPVPP